MLFLLLFKFALLLRKGMQKRIFQEPNKWDFRYLVHIVIKDSKH